MLPIVTGAAREFLLAYPKKSLADDAAAKKKTKPVKAYRD